MNIQTKVGIRLGIFQFIGSTINFYFLRAFVAFRVGIRLGIFHLIEQQEQMYFLSFLFIFISFIPSVPPLAVVVPLFN